MGGNNSSLRAQDGGRSARQYNTGTAYAQASWSFIRGAPPHELLDMPSYAPKKFSTRASAGVADVNAAKNVFPCFRGGMLFRIIDVRQGDGQRGGWHFYNDTADMECHVEYHFGPGSQLYCPAHVTVEPSALPGCEGWVCAHMTVFPSETLRFIFGDSPVVNGFRSVYRIAPLSDKVASRRQDEITAITANLHSEIEVVAKLTADMDSPTEQQIVERCARQRVPFVDMVFAPSTLSIFGIADPSSLGSGATTIGGGGGGGAHHHQHSGGGGVRAGADVAQLESDARDLHRRLPPIVWMRPRQFLSAREAAESAAIISGVDVLDIEPGFLGDTWLQSAIAGVAEHPETIEWLFRDCVERVEEEVAPQLVVTAPAAATPSAAAAVNDDPCKPSAAADAADGTDSLASPTSTVAPTPNATAAAAAAAAATVAAEAAAAADATAARAASNLVVTIKKPLNPARVAEQNVGAYRVWLNVWGWWTPVHLDDYIPCIGNRPAFASNRRDRRELWPAMLTKAFAKIYGSYAALSGGDPLLAYRTLTGYPTTRFDDAWAQACRALTPDENEDFNQYMMQCRNNGFMMCLNTRGVDQTFAGDLAGDGADQAQCQQLLEKYEAIGLALGHSYTVLDIKYFTKWKLLLLKVRNAFGTGREWNKNWSDTSDMWARFPEVAAECKPDRVADDGIFWIAHEDAVHYFSGGGVCFWRPEQWLDHRVLGRFADSHSSVCLELCVLRKTQITLMLSQKDPYGSNGEPLSAMMLSIAAPLGRGSTPTPSASGSDLQQPPHHVAAPTADEMATNDTAYMVEWNSTTNPQSPSPDFTFTFARDLAIIIELEPADRPYLVAPRVFDAGVTKQYVLGVLSEHRAGLRESPFDARFVEIDPECDLFRNRRIVHVDAGMSRPVDAHYQVKTRAGVKQAVAASFK